MSGAGGEARRALLGYERLLWGPGTPYSTMSEYMQVSLNELTRKVDAFVGDDRASNETAGGGDAEHGAFTGCAPSPAQDDQPVIPAKNDATRCEA